MNILVVDDDRDSADGIAALLTHWDHRAWVAYDPRRALELFREHRPDVVLLDIGLPGMDGYEVAGRLSNEDACKGTINTAVSGYGQEDDRRRSRAAGFHHHLVKPVDFDSLISLLAQPGDTP